VLTGLHVTAYTPLFGAFPVSTAMDIAAGLTGLQDGIFYPGSLPAETPPFNILTDPQPLETNASLSVLEPAGSDRLHHYRITL